MGFVTRSKGMYRRPNGKWALDKLVMGIRIADVLETKSEATAAKTLRRRIEETRNEVLLGRQKSAEPPKRSHGKLRLGEVIERYEKEGMEDIKSEAHGKKRLRALRKLCDFLGADEYLSEITTAKLKLYRQTFTRRNKKPAYINNMVYLAASSLFTFVREVLEIPNICQVTWKKVKLKFKNERIRSLTRTEEENLYKVLVDKDYYVHRMAIKIGLRASEIVNLKWTDIKTDARNITTITKFNRELTLPISEEVGRILAAVAGDHDEYVFTYKASRFDHKLKQLVDVRLPFTYAILSERARTAFRAAGIEDYRFHDHRHTCATRLYREKKNAKVVQRVLGHHNIASCNRYIHVNDDDIVEAFESVDRSEALARKGGFTFGVALGFDSLAHIARINRWNDNDAKVA